jgi:hypothetical protein
MYPIIRKETGCHPKAITQIDEGSVVVKALCYKSEGRGFETRCRELIFFSIYVILQAALGPGVFSALPLSVCPLSRQCGILNISQSYRPPRPVKGDSFTLWRRSVLPVRYELDCKYRYK